MEGYVDVMTAAALTGEGERRVREKVEGGVYQTIKRTGQRGGVSGESYLIKVASLPRPAQITYHAQYDHVPYDFDYAGYQQRFGTNGMDVLMKRLKAVYEGRALQAMRPPNLASEMAALARECKTSTRNLYRWIEAYEAKGPAGVANAMNRADKGELKSICLAAQREGARLFLQDNKRTKATVWIMLLDMQRRLGPDACASCAHNADSPARTQILGTEEEADYPPCADPNKCGLVVPESRQTMGRILGSIPDDMVVLARRGVKAWKDTHMVMATRAKPELVNAVWFGDHHQLDAFCLDERGKAVRPWLTAWYDAATGAVVGWVLSTNPNTDTILEAFINAVGMKSSVPFHGLPVALYIDNGKDYRSKVFEGTESDIDLGELNSSFVAKSVIQLFNISVTHAKPYQGWSKTIERFFGTLESKWIREVPGWCGNSPAERPETFNRDLRRWIADGTLWTLDQMYAYIHDTALPEYHARPHEGHGGRAPIELYAELQRARDDQPSAAMLYGAREHFETRRIRQEGIMFRKALYWDAALMYHVGKEVVIRYSKGDVSDITVLLDDHFLCNAELREHFKLIGESPERLEEHNARQNRQRAETRDRIRRATKSAFSESLDEKRNAGTITGIEYEKAHRAKKARKQQQAERDAAASAPEGAVSGMLISYYDEVMSRQKAVR